jgi:hypothetical protein
MTKIKRKQTHQPYQHRREVLVETLLVLDSRFGMKKVKVLATITDVPHISLAYRRLYAGVPG